MHGREISRIKYRTTLTIKFDNINQLVYADEVAGNRLRIWGNTANATTTSATRNLSLYSEYRPLATSSLAGATGAVVSMTVAVNMPYAANGGTYVDNTLQYNTKIQSNYCETVPPSCSSDNWLIGVVSIIDSFGASGPGSVSHVNALQKRDKTHTTAENPSDPKHIWLQKFPSLGGVPAFCAQLMSGGLPYVPPGPTPDPLCYEQQQSTIAETMLAETSAVLTLIDGVNASALQQHFTIGLVTSGESIGSITEVTMQSSVSANSVVSLASDRSSAFLSTVATLSRLEGGALEQIFDAWEGGAAPSMMVRSNSQNIAFYDVNSANVSEATARLGNYTTNTIAAINSYTSASYRLIVPVSGEAGQFCISSSCIIYLSNGMSAYAPDGTVMAYLTTGLDQDKGAGGAAALDPTTSAFQSVKTMDYAQKGRTHYGVDLRNAALQLTPGPDLVTGTGDFPQSLSFQRVYSADSIGFNCGVAIVECPQIDLDLARLGGGWTYTLSVDATMASDGLAGLGRDTALSAAGAVAALFVDRNLNNAPTSIRSDLATIFTTHWLVSGLFSNVVTVRKPPSTLRDGLTFDPGPNNPTVLTQTGSRNLAGWGPAADTVWNPSYVSFSLIEKDGSTLSFQHYFGGTATYGGTARWPNL